MSVQEQCPAALTLALGLEMLTPSAQAARLEEERSRHVVVVEAVQSSAAQGQLADEDIRALVNAKGSIEQIDQVLAGGICGWPLDKPLPYPEQIYHPGQIVWKLDKEKGGKVFERAHGTSENLGRLIVEYGVRIRYNELSREVEISVNGDLPGGDLARSVSLSLIEDVCRINRYPYTAAAGHLDYLASQDSYNPALEWVNSRPWDQKGRITQLFECLTLTDPSKQEISKVLFRKWFIGAAAILAGIANKFEHVLVLVDPLGGEGKTRFFNSFCPEVFQADGVTLSPDNKDSVLPVISKWLVELGEIDATFRKSDIASLKAFLSKDTDEIRPAYAKAAHRYKRRTAFFGSVNTVQFLMDDTNNRRFWPIQVSAVNHKHDIDMQQLWAEAMTFAQAGERWYLDPAENRAIADYNEEFRCRDRVEEMILAMYRTSDLATRWLTASEVLEEIGVANPKQTDTRRAATILRKLYERKKSNGVDRYHLPTPLPNMVRQA